MAVLFLTFSDCSSLSLVFKLGVFLIVLELFRISSTKLICDFSRTGRELVKREINVCDQSNTEVYSLFTLIFLSLVLNGWWLIFWFISPNIDFMKVSVFSGSQSYSFLVNEIIKGFNLSFILLKLIAWLGSTDPVGYHSREIPRSRSTCYFSKKY